MKYLFFVFTAVMTLGFMSSCKHEPINLPDNDTWCEGCVDNDCDPDSIYFEIDVLPILVSNCTTSGCHSVESHEHRIVLNNYQNVIITGEVTPFSLSENKIYTSLFRNGRDRMPPPPANPLSEDEKNIIKKWIEQGALNLSCNTLINCDTTGSSYSQDVVPILQSSCIGCHNSTLSSGNIKLNTYNLVKESVDDGTLLGSILGDYGYVKMPLGANSISSCNTKIITNWINEGALNN